LEPNKEQGQREQPAQSEPPEQLGGSGQPLGYGHPDNQGSPESRPPTEQRPARQPLSKVFKLVVLSAAAAYALCISFMLGNWLSSSGVWDIGNGGGSASFQTGATGTTGGDADQNVSVRQFSARMDEVAAILNSGALHVFSQGEIDQATKESIEALLRSSGDIRAQYFTAAEYQEYQRMNNAEFVGIGVELSTNANWQVYVSRVFDNSPAQDSGVLPGDVVVAVDGVRKNWIAEEVVTAVRRPEGEQVTMLWSRNGQELTTTMTVRTVHRPLVRTELLYEGDIPIGYLSLEQFAAGSADELRTGIQSLDAQGAQCYVLDLRNNPGGLLEQAVAVTSLFLADGEVVRIETRNGTQVEKVSGKVATGKGMVVLLNGGSASASELVSAALQDHGRAKVLGEVTYGKGTVQDLKELSFGGAVKYTIAHYLSPSGRSIDGVGITPDIVIDDGIAENNADFIHQLEAAAASGGTDSGAAADGNVQPSTDGAVEPSAPVPGAEDTGPQPGAEGEQPTNDAAQPQPTNDAAQPQPGSEVGLNPSAAKLYPGEEGYVYQHGADVQLDAALEYLGSLVK